MKTQKSHCYIFGAQRTSGGRTSAPSVQRFLRAIIEHEDAAWNEVIAGKAMPLFEN